jgi:hypothetical protein
LDAYFRKLPTVQYNDLTVKDISRSSRFTDLARKQGTLFYPLELNAGLRPDALADAYYGDAEMDWLIWLTNNITDPYYNWYLSELEFDDFIATKYGSYEDAVKTILYYQNNWGKLEETLTPSYYENNLAPVLKKYYTPEFADNLKILRYIRRGEDWTVSTNRIMNFTVNATSTFTTDERLHIWDGIGNEIGLGYVVTSNSSDVMIQHVSGNTTANSTVTRTLIGETSNVSVTTNQSNVVQISISDLEAVFWDPVTAYDYEFALNESRKDLLIIASEYAPKISEQLRKQLNT